LQLEARLANRRLTPDQQKTLGATLRPFAGIHINLFAMGGDSEIVGIGNDVLTALAAPTLAAWNVTVGSGQDSAIMSSGILVEVAVDADATAQRAASSLIAALRHENLAVSGPLPESKGAIMGNVSRDPSAKIRVVIAKRP